VKRIALIPGDGIGPEVIAQAVRVLGVLRDGGLPLTWEEFPYSADYYLSEGRALPEGGLKALGAFDAILVGAFGDPRVPDMAHAKEILLGARRGLDLYVNERPVRLLHERITPLKGLGRADVNFVIFRENTEGAYVGAGGALMAGTPYEVALQSALATRKGVERIVRRAFERASGLPRKRLHMADKHNALEFIGNLWYRVFLEVAVDFPEVQAGHIFIDTLCHDLVRDPAKFEVIVTSNLFGDMISDLGAALAGGLGVAPSANVNPEARLGLFEPVHGSAPHMAGRDQANPLAACLSAAMMLDFLGFSPEARRVERAAQACVARGEVTRDLGGNLGTVGAGDALCDCLRDPGRDGAEWA
jgi:3-isopropylmalate dehydrogenase